MTSLRSRIEKALEEAYYRPGSTRRQMFVEQADAIMGIIEGEKESLAKEVEGLAFVSPVASGYNQAIEEAAERIRSLDLDKE